MKHTRLAASVEEMSINSAGICLKIIPVICIGFLRMSNFIYMAGGVLNDYGPLAAVGKWA